MWASSSVGQSTRLISVGSEVQVLPGPPCFRVAEIWCPGGMGKRPARRGAVCGWGCFLVVSGSDCGCGGLAQLVEHLLCKQGVSGSNPLASIVRRVLRLGVFLAPLTRFPDGARAPWLGMFFETVNRIWRMDCLPMRLQRWGGREG